MSEATTRPIADAIDARLEQIRMLADQIGEAVQGATELVSDAAAIEDTAPRAKPAASSLGRLEALLSAAAQLAPELEDGIGPDLWPKLTALEALIESAQASLREAQALAG